MISQIYVLYLVFFYANYVYSFICSCTKFQPISASFIPGSEPGKRRNYTIRIDQPTPIITIDYYSGRIWWLRVIKCRWFVFCRRRRCPTFEIAQYGPHTSLFCTGKMADACPVCLYKQEISSRGITFICAPFFC